MRGRIFGLSGVTFVAMPLGVLAAGFLIQGFGVRLALVLQAACILAAALILSRLPALHALDHAAEADEIAVRQL